jgi:hypothetical protein
LSDAELVIMMEGMWESISLSIVEMATSLQEDVIRSRFYVQSKHYVPFY